MDDQYYISPQQEYQYQYQPPQKEKGNGLSIASMVCGLVAFFCCNPLYMVSTAAVILGIVALCVNRSKGMAITGIVLGALSVIIWVVIDILLAPFTLGVSFFI